ncbi:hypothetical protein, partial [Corynebacterium sp.]|uniref:hypothetical protein n=1 Tax=Corynebacterium sp. TaxID=1720 RepID=UPI001DBF83A3
MSASAPAAVDTAKTNSRSADEYTQPRSQLSRWLRGFFGLGRENHLMMLGHYQETKNMLVSYSDQPAGLF